LGFGVWGFGFWVWGIGPNPQSPIPNYNLLKIEFELNKFNQIKIF